MPIKVVTQTTLIEGKATKTTADNWMDDCGVTSAGMAVQWATKGAITVTPQQSWDAGAKAGRKDVDGAGNGTSAVELVKTAKVLGAHAVVVRSWDAAKNAARKGAAIVTNVDAPLGIPERVWSDWQKKRAKGKPPYGHWCVLACDGGQWEYADPTMSATGKEVYGKAISEKEADSIAHSKTLAKKTPIWIVVTATAPAPKTPAKKPVQAPQKPQNASKPKAVLPVPPKPKEKPANVALQAELAATLKEIKVTPWGAAQRALWKRVDEIHRKLRGK